MICSLDKNEILRGIETTGLTQLEFCRRNGIAINDMRKALSKGEANAETTNKIAKGLGLRPVELVKKKYAL